MRWCLTIIFLATASIGRGQEPSAKPLAENWDYVVPMKKIAGKFRGHEGVVIHVGGSMTIANPYGTWARSGKGKTRDDEAILKWMHTDKKDKTDGWWLCRTEVVSYRAHTAESGLKSAMLTSGKKVVGYVPNVPVDWPIRSV